MKTFAVLSKPANGFLVCALVALLSLLAGPALAQTDTIVRTNGDEVPGRVLTISPLVISYTAGADTVRVPTASVFMIRYANGTKEVIARLTTSSEAATGPEGLTNSQLAVRGQADARAGYRARDVLAGAAAATFFCGPVLGLIPTATIASTPVKARNLGTPAPALLPNSNYAASYYQQANAIKRQQAWKGYGIGVGLQVLLIGMLLSSAGH